MHDGRSRTHLLVASSFGLALALLASPRIAHADEGQPLPALPAPAPAPAQPAQPASAQPARATPAQAAPTRAAEPAVSSEPSSSAMPTFVGSEAPPKDERARKTHPRYWLTATGAVVFGGAYAANAILFPLAAIAPPDGTNSPSTLWYVTPVAGPFALAAKLSQYDTGLRRFEWIDGTLQCVGLVMVAASLIFPVEEGEKPAQTATVHPIVGPKFVGAGGTF